MRFIRAFFASAIIHSHPPVRFRPHEVHRDRRNLLEVPSSAALGHTALTTWTQVPSLRRRFHLLPLDLLETRLLSRQEELAPIPPGMSRLLPMWHE